MTFSDSPDVGARLLADPTGAPSAAPLSPACAGVPVPPSRREDAEHDHSRGDTLTDENLEAGAWL